VQERVFTPIAGNVAVYNRLFKLYRSLHDSFGLKGHQEDLSGVMKDLLQLRDEARD
jgi:L-ribulokinase